MYVCMYATYAGSVYAWGMVTGCAQNYVNVAFEYLLSIEYFINFSMVGQEPFR